MKWQTDPYCKAMILAVRISLPFRFIFFYKFNCTDPALQLGDPAPLIGLCCGLADILYISYVFSCFPVFSHVFLCVPPVFLCFPPVFPFSSDFQCFTLFCHVFPFFPMFFYVFPRFPMFSHVFLCFPVIFHVFLYFPLFS